MPPSRVAGYDVNGAWPLRKPKSVDNVLKDRLIGRLDEMGVNGFTLELGDSTIETVASDIVSAEGLNRNPGRRA